MTDDEVEEFERGWRLRLLIMLASSLIAITGLAWYGYWLLVAAATLAVGFCAAALIWLRDYIRRNS